MTQIGNASEVRRPLTARSVVASTLLGVDPPWLPTSSLVATATLFGVAEGTARVALSRMTTRGELAPEHGGYHLAGALAERHGRQRQSRFAEQRPWNGTWEVAVVGPGARSAAARASLRAALASLRMAEWREGVWLRPDNLDPGRLPNATATRDEQCSVLSGAAPSLPTNDSASLPLVVADLWPLQRWSDTARGLLAEMGDLRPATEHGDADALAPAFECAAAVLRHLQADPLLPVELLPDAWPGPTLRAAYEPFEAAFRSAHMRWLQATLPS